jgi:intracellular septation protein A
MNHILLQMLPLLVFVVVDMIFTNTAISIGSAVVFAVFQMGFTFIKTGSPDYLILIDVALIVGLGALSIFLKNDLFFKMKPAIIEAIMVLLIVALAFAPDRFLLSYLSRFMPQGASLVPEAMPILKKMLLGMALYTVFHIGAVWYTAYHSSRKIWALVSGPGYFFIFIPIMAFILFKKYRVRAVS